MEALFGWSLVEFSEAPGRQGEAPGAGLYLRLPASTVSIYLLRHCTYLGYTPAYQLQSVFALMTKLWRQWFPPVPYNWASWANGGANTSRIPREPRTARRARGLARAASAWANPPD